MPLYGVYGRHTPEACPLNNIETAKHLHALAQGELKATAERYRIDAIVGQYHSALEHTFLWVLKAEDPHLVQDFCVEIGLARFNELKIVPLITFEEGVIPGLRKAHGL